MLIGVLLHDACYIPIDASMNMVFQAYSLIFLHYSSQNYFQNIHFHPPSTIECYIEYLCELNTWGADLPHRSSFNICITLFYIIFSKCRNVYLINHYVTFSNKMFLLMILLFQPKLLSKYTFLSTQYYRVINKRLV